MGGLLLATTPIWFEVGTKLHLSYYLAGLQLTKALEVSI